MAAQCRDIADHEPFAPSLPPSYALMKCVACTGVPIEEARFELAIGATRNRVAPAPKGTDLSLFMRACRSGSPPASTAAEAGCSAWHQLARLRKP
jgi:hypothetical protein